MFCHQHGLFVLLRGESSLPFVVLPGSVPAELFRDTGDPLGFVGNGGGARRVLPTAKHAGFDRETAWTPRGG
jgi:hypothetical protein